MSDQDMFNENTPPEKQETPATPDKPNNDPFVDRLNKIVNEQGVPKYKDVDTALEALAESQRFIETLKAEKAEEKRLREEREMELAKMGSIDDFVKKLRPSEQKTDKVDQPSTDTLSEEKVRELLENQFTQRELQAQQQRNLEQVVSKLSEKHGDKAAAYIKQRAKELDTTPEELKKLSMTNPKLASELLSSKASSDTAPSQSSFTRQATPDTGPKKPQWEHSATRGGLTGRQLADRFKEVQEYTNKRIGLET